MIYFSALTTLQNGFFGSIGIRINRISIGSFWIRFRRRENSGGSIMRSFASVGSAVRVQEFPYKQVHNQNSRQKTSSKNNNRKLQWERVASTS
jgi:hypothetical protein